jgi:hypothetical protein
LSFSGGKSARVIEALADIANASTTALDAMSGKP